MGRCQRKILVLLLLSVLGAAPAIPLHAQEEGTGLKPEFGFWIGASNPMPMTPVDEVLDANIGGGLFYRIQWPWVFHLETGLSYANFRSRTTQSLTIMPVYGALDYQLPLAFQLNIFLKLGGGTAWLEVRPANKSGWDPMLFAGAEFSIQAGRKVRIGLRLDYNMIYEKHLEPPQEAELLRYFGTTDPRYQTNTNIRIHNGAFFHFGLMVSFFL